MDINIIAAKQAVEYARKWAVDDDKGPLFLEFVTYRYRGHLHVPFLNPYLYRRHPPTFNHVQDGRLCSRG